MCADQHLLQGASRLRLPSCTSTPLRRCYILRTCTHTPGSPLKKTCCESCVPHYYRMASLSVVIRTQQRCVVTSYHKRSARQANGRQRQLRDNCPCSHVRHCCEQLLQYSVLPRFQTCRALYVRAWVQTAKYKVTLRAGVRST